MIIRERSSEQKFPDFFKVVVDIDRKILAMGCELHIDCAEELLKDGSSSKSLWGADIYDGEKIDFVSMINIRPADGNRSMQITIPEIRKKVEGVIRSLLL